MTTFIDFRYTSSLASAMFTGHEKEESSLFFSPEKENYFAVECRHMPQSKIIFDLTDAEGKSRAVITTGTDGAVSLVDQYGKTLVSTPVFSSQDKNNQILGVRLSDRTSGFKLDGICYEKQASVFKNMDSGLFLKITDDPLIRVMGLGTGRAERWAELFYNRKEPTGLQAEMVIDWHHLRAGIPFCGTMVAEKLIEQNLFRLKFRSYAYTEEETQGSDMVRLFNSPGDVEIAVHVTPPHYAQFDPAVPNIGFFVTETMNIQPDLIKRGNSMDSICVPSSFAYKAFKKNGVYRPMCVIPHAVDLDFFQPVEQRQSLPGGRRFNFLSVATHVERKNMQTVVRAFLEEFREHEDVALFLLLRPEYHTTQNNVALTFMDWEAQYMRNSAPVYLWTGYLTNEHLKDLYANANAYVMPSNEGFGLTLLEAMACETPVIGLDYGGVLDFLSPETGYLVSRGRSFIAKNIDSMSYIGDRFYEPDLSKLRAAMRHVFENEDKARVKASKARLNCIKHFNWDHVADEFTRLIEDVYTDRHASPHQSREKNKDSPAVPFISWILCIPDTPPIKSSLRYLKTKKSRSKNILCLFTRYARVKDILRARKNEYMFYRWDGSRGNCEVIGTSLLGKDWIGLLYPGERTAGDEERFFSFLKSLPEGINRVSVKCENGVEDCRFFRFQPKNIPQQTAHCPEFRIIREISQ